MVVRTGGRLALVVVDDVSQVVSAAVVGFTHAHGVVSEVHVAVVAFGRLAWLEM